MYKIISDGSCDLGVELAEKLDVDVIPFYVSLDGKTHQKEIEELAVNDFYKFCIDNPKIFPKTSMPAVQQYYDMFEKSIKEGLDIICICISTKFSGSFNSAMTAKNMILEEYNDCTIEVIDAIINTVLQGQLVEQAVIMKEKGLSLQETVAGINEIKETGRILFTIDSMDYLVNGGRVGKLSGIASNVLGLRPLIILHDGEIFSNGVVRGRKRAKKKLLSQISNYFTDNDLQIDDYDLAVGYGYDKKEGEQFLEEVKQLLATLYPNAIINIKLRQIGATIGVHTGPLPLGIGLIKKFK